MLTPYQKRQKDEDLMFDDVDEKRKTKDERRKTSIEKEQKKVKKRFQNKCVSSQNHRYKKRRGRHGRIHRPFCFPTFSQRAASLFCLQAGRAAFFHGNLQTFSGKAPLTTTNVLPSTRNETPAIFRLKLIDSPKQMRYKYM